MKQECSVIDCKTSVLAKTLCNKHYIRLKKYGSLDGNGKYSFRNMPIKERFWKWVEKTESCWNWIGCLSNAGYGSFSLGKINGKAKSVLAHRFSYEILVGNIPNGLTIDHLCRNRKCVNPKHLEAVTMQVNNLRGYGASGINARKTHCVNGHEFNSINTRYYADRRRCLVCLKKTDGLTVQHD